jgi:hypothetical protein
MKKLRAKTVDRYDLKLRWSPARADSIAPVCAPRNVEEYLDFLEEVVPKKRDESPVKLYKERFQL